jgi:glutamate racemase
MISIGVFDSGVGGLSVANAIQKALPDVKVILKEDSKNLPYGTKTPEQLLKLVEPILQQMISEGCQVIVVACNTVTTTIINELRHRISVPLIGMEPMVKPASEQTKTGIFAVFATPTTLASKRYAELKATYAQDKRVIEPDCSTWSYMIEHDEVDEDRIRRNVVLALDEGADIIVLGCTHYHWIETLIRSLAEGKAQVLQPEQPVIAQLKKVLERTV